MSTLPVPTVPPPVPSTTSSVTSESPSTSLPPSTTPTSPTPVPPTTPSTTSTSSDTTLSSSSTSTSIPPSTSTTSLASSITSTSSTTTSSTSQPSSSTTSIPIVVQTSDGQLITRTSFVTVSSTPPTQSPTSQSSNGFFHNKGAMAGVFSVVGVVAIVLVFFLFTSYLRRRRAREFDREIDEAAAAAAAAQPPDFDDYDYTSATGGYGHYSETSHGTFSQPPLSHDQSANVHGSYDSYAGAGAGAAGIGARGRSLRNGGQQDPYGALANPPEQYEMHETGRTWQQGNPRGGAGVTNYDILQAAGLSSSDPYAVARGPSTRSGLSHGNSQSGASGLTRSQSQGTSTLPTTVEGYPLAMPMPASGYPGGQDTAYVPGEKARYSASYAPGGGVSTMPTMPLDEDEDAYDGYQEQPSGTLDNPHSPGFAGPRVGEDADERNGRAPYAQEREEAGRASFADDEDYGFSSGQRVLRVANE